MTKKIMLLFLALSIAALLSLPTQVFASVSNDQVQSQHIREADGTSGQNTNSGAGVKTGHIQDGAITTNKITDNAVTTQKVADGAITTQKIVDGAIPTSKVADGAITDSKIAGPISGSKISSTGLNADTVDGMHASDLATAVHSHNQGT
ncbi:MAG: hypothetical protein HZA17_05860 [Nitrospirae bacterium]|nr:hypothetical protein [Nitrospirota bacterium]